MASKRVMYRPALQENVGQRRNRKPLSQGRLISNGDNIKIKPTHLVSGVEDNNSSKKPQSPYTSFVSQTNEATVIPRNVPPSITEKHSPHRNIRADSLDLSDSEDDLPVHYKSQEIRVHKQQPSEVLLVDASRQTKDPNQSEVDVLIGYEKSPVRIVCHSPSKVDTDLRSSKNRSIKVAGVNSVKIIKENHKTPLAEALSPSEPSRTLDNFSLLTQIEKDMRNHKIPQPNFDDSQDSDVSEKPVQDVGLHPMQQDDNQSVISGSDAFSVDNFVSTKSSKSVKKKSENIKKIPQIGKTPQTARKKSSRPVASRYLQAADAKVKTSLSVLYPKQTKTDKTASGRISRSMDIGPKSARKISRKSKDSSTEFSSPRNLAKTKPSSEDIVNGTSHIPETGAHTPDNSHMTTGGQTSTPTHDGSEFPHEIDASAIHPEISVLSTGEGSKSYNSALSNASVSVPVKKKPPTKMTQNQLDMIYCRYIQSLYLSTKAQKTREEQEKQAMAQIQGLHSEMEKLQKKNHELDKELLRLKHLNEVDQQIELQRQSLAPIVSSLPQLTKEYDTLAHALDTTRHQIPTKGVYIPDDEDQYQRDLEKALLESEQLLGELSVMIRRDLPSVTAMSAALSAMEKSTDNQCEELVKCNEMIAATQSLTIQETSMKIQAIQAKEVGAA